MTRTSHVIFDFDGTLVDSNEIKRDGFFRVVERHHEGRARMQSVLEGVAGDRHTLFEAYVARLRRDLGEPDCNASDLVRAYSTLVDQAVAGAVEMPGVTTLLQTLRQHGVKTYLSSATPIDSLDAIIAARGWQPWFDGVFGHPRSKIETIEALLADSGAGAETFAVVGDGVDDRISAEATGCRFFAVGEGRGRRKGEVLFTLDALAPLLIQ